ncbi:MAG: DNA/RNA nuclease SfsA [Maricaulaceae bacterium]
MKFPAPIEKGRLVQRYKRFLADIDLGGNVITAHCANPGSMMGLKESGSTVWVTPANNPKRKLQYDWQVIEVGAAKVCINTGLANKIVHEALRTQAVPHLAAYSTITPEQKYGENSRIDFLLTEAGLPDCYVEVKSVTLSREAALASFPDSKTTRGTKHLNELASMASTGHRAVMLYLVNRTDCTHFTLAADIDPDYAAAFDAAKAAGVEAYAYRVDITPSGIILTTELPIDI